MVSTVSTAQLYHSGCHRRQVFVTSHDRKGKCRFNTGGRDLKAVAERPRTVLVPSPTTLITTAKRLTFSYRPPLEGLILYDTSPPPYNRSALYPSAVFFFTVGLQVLDWVYERSTISWLPAQPVEKVDLEELGVVSSP